MTSAGKSDLCAHYYAYLALGLTMCRNYAFKGTFVWLYTQYRLEYKGNLAWHCDL